MSSPHRTQTHAPARARAARDRLETAREVDADVLTIFVRAMREREPAP